MPTSRFSQLNEIVETICRTKPDSLLDVGIGFGKYGFLAREYLELWDGRGKYGDWHKVIDGIEAYEQYVTDLQRLIYDHIYVGNALDIVPTLPRQYDLALVIDVLEHFDQAEGLKFLDALQAKAANVLISTPWRMSHQKAAFGNVMETHKHQWSRAELSRRGDCVFIPNDDSLILYIGRDAPRLRELAWSWPRRLMLWAPALKPVCKKLLIRKRWRASARQEAQGADRPDPEQTRKLE